MPEGKLVGEILNGLLQEVIDGEVENEHHVLCCRAQAVMLVKAGLDDRLKDAAQRSGAAIDAPFVVSRDCMMCK